MRHPRRFLVGGIAIVLITVAGCGNSSSSGGTTGSSGGSGGYGAPAAVTTAASKAATTAAGNTAAVGTANTALGTFLVDGNGGTLYLWKADTGSTSTCDGACTQAWPPLTTTGKPTATGAAKASLLGTTKRSDGTLQVTYAGHPLYTYAEDAAAGQTNGQGSDEFGALWLVVDPAGTAIGP